MKLLPLFTCALLAGCASPINVVSQTGASIEIECTTLVQGCSPQAIADKAEAHCKQRGMSAAVTKMLTAPSGSRRAIYECVP